MADDYMDISSYSTDTITLTNDYNTVTINEDSGFTLQGMTSSSGTVSIDTTMLDNSIRIGDTKLTEDVEAPPTNQNPELTNQSESSRNRIPPGLKCDQKNAPDRITWS